MPVVGFATISTYFRARRKPFCGSFFERHTFVKLLKSAIPVLPPQLLTGLDPFAVLACGTLFSNIRNTE